MKHEVNMSNKVGRPKNAIDLDSKELISLDECVKRLQELWGLPVPPYTRRTLQNKISKNEFKRYGPHRLTLVDWKEVREKELRKNCG